MSIPDDGLLITPGEYLASPTALDTGNLIPGGGGVEQTNALLGVIRRASGMIGSFLDYPPPAHSVSETTPVNPQGTPFGFTADLVARHKPVIGLTAVAAGAKPSALTAQTLTDSWIHNNVISAVVPRRSAFATWTYIAGWPHMRLAGNANTAATTITVNQTTGVQDGDILTLIDNEVQEQITVTSSTATTITFTPALTVAHTVPTSPNLTHATGIPAAIRQATIHVVSALLKTRGGTPMVLDSMSGATVQTTDSGAGDEMRQAHTLLAPYRRVI